MDLLEYTGMLHLEVMGVLYNYNHVGQDPNGEIMEMTRSEHRLGLNDKKNRSSKRKCPSKIDRHELGPQRQKYLEGECDLGRLKGSKHKNKE